MFKLFILFLFTLSFSKEIILIDNLIYQNSPLTKEDRESFFQSKKGKRVLNLKDAKKYCKNLKLNKYKNWRLPTKEELEKLMGNWIKNSRGDEFFIRKEFIENMPYIYDKYNNPYFWTSSKENINVNWAFSFNAYGDLEIPFIEVLHKSCYNYVMCVTKD